MDRDRRFVTPIVLIALIAMLGFGVWWGWQQMTRPVDPWASQPCVTQEATQLSVANVTVKVLNAGTAAGRAGQITQQLADKGFKTENPGNSTEDFPQTTIIGGDAQSPEVQLVAGFFPESVTQGDGRETGSVDVIVTDNFAGFNDQAPTVIDVPAGTVCLPPETTTPLADQPSTSGP